MKNKKRIVLVSCLNILPILGMGFNIISPIIGWIGFILIASVNLFLIIWTTRF